MDREQGINLALRVVAYTGGIISVIIFFVAELYLLPGIIFLFSVIAWCIFFLRTRDPFPTMAIILQRELRKKKSFDSRYVLEVLDIHGVQIKSQKGISYVEKKSIEEKSTLLRYRIRRSRPRLAEAILDRIITDTRNSTIEELARTLEMCAAGKQEDLEEFLKEELAEVRENIIPDYMLRMYVWESPVEVVVFVLAERPGGNKGSSAVELVERHTYVRHKNHQALYKELHDVYGKFSLEEIQNMIIFAQSISVHIDHEVVRITISGENMEDTWEIIELGSLDYLF